MAKRPLDINNLHLLHDLTLAVVTARLTMDAASARADLLCNIFLTNVKMSNSKESFIDRAVNNLEVDLLDSRDAPEQLKIATEEMASVMWSYRMVPSDSADQRVREAFERWEAVYYQVMGEPPIETYMDMENARCRSEVDYYSEPPLPFGSRVRVDRGN